MNYNLNDSIKFNDTFNINLDAFANGVKVRYKNKVYHIDVEKLLEQFGSLVELVFDYDKE